MRHPKCIQNTPRVRYQQLRLLAPWVDGPHTEVHELTSILWALVIHPTHHRLVHAVPTHVVDNVLFIESIPKESKHK